MLKKIIAVCAALAVSVVVGTSATAGEATSVFMEITAGTYEIFNDTDHPVRARVLLADDDGNPATTFAGQPIAGQATLVLSSENFADTVQISFTPLGVPLEWRPAGEADIVLQGPAREFALRYDDGDTIPDAPGADTIIATLVRGDDTIEGSFDITVIAPEADVIVVRSGDIQIPDVLEEIPPVNNNDAETLSAGESLTVHAMAAYRKPATGNPQHLVDTLYFTDNVPAGFDRAALLGFFVNPEREALIADGAPAAVFAQGTVNTVPQAMIIAQEAEFELTGGYHSLAFSVEDLKIPALLIQMQVWELIADQEDQEAALADLLDPAAAALYPYRLHWTAVPLISEAIGRLGDIGDFIDVLPDRNRARATPLHRKGVAFDQAFPWDGWDQAREYDTSIHMPGLLDKVTVVGLPINTVDGRRVNTGPVFGEIYPTDAYFLTGNPRATTYEMTVQGDPLPGLDTWQGSAGAILGWDAWGNPAPILSDTSDVLSVAAGTGSLLAAGAGFPVSGCLMSLSSGVCTYGYNAGDDVGEFQCPGGEAYSSFLPFDNFCNKNNFKDLYIDAITDVSDEKFASVSTAALGVNYVTSTFIAGVRFLEGGTVAPPRPEIYSFKGEVARDRFFIEATGNADGEDVSFRVMRVIHAGTGSPVGLNERNTNQPATLPFAVPNGGDSANIYMAKQEFILFGALQNQDAIFVIQGEESETFAAVRMPDLDPANPNPPPGPVPFNDMLPADARGFDLSVLEPGITTYVPMLTRKLGQDSFMIQNNAVVDSNGVAVRLSGFTLLDAFGNPYATLADARIRASTTFPGARAEVVGDALELTFDLDQITAECTTAIIELRSFLGGLSSEIAVRFLAAHELSLDKIFADIEFEDIISVPCIVYLADRRGNLMRPLNDAGAVTGEGVRVIFEAENGSTSVRDVALTYAEPHAIFRVFREQAPDPVIVTGSDDDRNYDDVSLILNFIPDLIRPVIGTPVPIDCGFTVRVTDNAGVDTDFFSVQVFDTTEDDITASLELSAVEDGTDAVFTVVSLDLQPGSYSATMRARDKAGNFSKIATRILTVAACTADQECSVNPLIVERGETVDLDISGRFTDFNAASAVLIDCDGVEVNNVDVISRRRIVANITVAEDAVPGVCPVAVDELVCDSIEIVTALCETDADCPAGFVCVDGVCVDAQPECETDADCPEGFVCIDNVCVVSVPECVTDADCPAGFICVDGVCVEEPCRLGIRPARVPSRLFLPAFRVLRITGTAGFDPSAGINDLGPIEVLRETPVGNSLRVLVRIPPGLEAGPVDVSVGGCTGTITIRSLRR